MGVVGAGGLGQRIHVAISLFHEHQSTTLLLAIYLIVTLVDALRSLRAAHDFFTKLHPRDSQPRRTEPSRGARSSKGTTKLAKVPQAGRSKNDLAGR
jgi:hypothetical protein